MRDHRSGEFFCDPFHLGHKGIRGDREKAPKENDRYREEPDHPGDEGPFGLGLLEAMLGQADFTLHSTSAS